MKLFHIALALLCSASPSSAVAARSIFVVHCEPNEPLPAMFTKLVQIVNIANNHEVLLTIELTPQWGQFISADSTRLAQIRVWQTQGHEIAAHHHGPYHAFWDFYSPRTDDELLVAGQDPLDRIGTLDDLRAVLEPVAGDSLLLTLGGPGLSDPEPEKEWHAAFPYRTSGGRNLTDAFSSPRLVALGPYEVCQVDHMFVDGQSAVDSLEAAFLSHPGVDVVGAVTHPSDFAANPAFLVDWFAFVRDNTERVTVRNVLRGAGCEAATSVGQPGDDGQLHSTSESRTPLGLTLWPNPASNHVEVRFSTPHVTPWWLSLHDAAGRVVRSSTSGETAFDVSSFPAGVYWVRAWTELGGVAAPLILTR